MRAADALHCCGLALLLVSGLPGSAAGVQDPLQLRREYNHVAASIDTLVRLYGGSDLDKLASRLQGGEGIVPVGYDLVVIFWADDEAELSLNGLRVGRTRLTPTMIEIPEMYLNQVNQIQARCWDTDRVESGFMAGVYLRDAAGLRPVLVTGDKKWRADGVPAEEIYYSHTQPDIPGAKVIWGSHLFGRVTLDAQFSARGLARAAAAPPRHAMRSKVQQRRMLADQVVSRLVQLQARRQELTAKLAGWDHDPPRVRYGGYITHDLAFSLGRAGPLTEKRSVATAQRLEQWAEMLPPDQQRLVFSKPRKLKGAAAATAALAGSQTGKAGEPDRRAAYHAPPERGGPVQESVALWRRAAPAESPLSVPADILWGQVAGVLGLAMYLAAVLWQWWRLFNSEEWNA